MPKAIEVFTGSLYGQRFSEVLYLRISWITLRPPKLTLHAKFNPVLQNHQYVRSLTFFFTHSFLSMSPLSHYYLPFHFYISLSFILFFMFSVIYHQPLFFIISLSYFICFHFPSRHFLYPFFWNSLSLCFLCPAFCSLLFFFIFFCVLPSHSLQIL
jgi:hypothetical protein